MHGLHRILLFHALACLGQNALGGKIINGEIAQQNSMQFMASLQNKRGHHVCGAFLITEDFVVTAAHCSNSEPTRVVLGAHNLKRSDDNKMRFIKERYKHPAYVDVGKGYDIMLLKLSASAPLDNTIKTIPLPKSDTDVKENQICRVAGWGKNTTSSNGKVVDELRVVDVSVINLQACTKAWPGLPANVICAGGDETKKGFCQGDSGGPLVCNGVAVGVVSFNRNFNCNYPDVPNVYTDISKHLPWINTILKVTKSY